MKKQPSAVVVNDHSYVSPSLYRFWVETNDTGGDGESEIDGRTQSIIGRYYQETEEARTNCNSIDKEASHSIVGYQNISCLIASQTERRAF